MAIHEPSRALRKLAQGYSKSIAWSPLECLAPRFARSMATEAPLPNTGYELNSSMSQLTASDTAALPSAAPAIGSSTTETSVLTTIFSWPTLEPMRFEQYPSNHLHLPLRRDILHRAVIYEGDKTRQGTASTKWRKDVHGSGRKLAPQKGTGIARVGDRKSPIRRGGGVAFGPHPRDFSTGLPRKVYDLAWRTALSYRYRRGQLLIVDNDISIPRHTGPHLLTNIFKGNGWDSRRGRGTLVTTRRRDRLFREMAEVRKHGIVKDMFDIDVKDLLETGRIVIEKQALDTILLAHTSDIGAKHNMKFAADLVARWRRSMGEIEELDEATEIDQTPTREDVDEVEEEVRREVEEATRYPTARA